MNIAFGVKQNNELRFRARIVLPKTQANNNECLVERPILEFGGQHESLPLINIQRYAAREQPCRIVVHSRSHNIGIRRNPAGRSGFQTKAERFPQ